MDEHASVVHIHGTGIFSSLLYNRLKKVGQNVVLTVHGIVDTDYVREMLNSISLKHTPNMFTIPQGIADVYFNLKHQDAEHKIVLAVGGLSGRKGHLITMRAFDKIADKHKDAELIIAGCVTSAPYYRSMMELKDSLPHGDRITILPDADYDVLLGLILRLRYSRCIVRRSLKALCLPRLWLPVCLSLPLTLAAYHTWCMMMRMASYANMAMWTPMPATWTACYLMKQAETSYLLATPRRPRNTTGLTLRMR